MPRDHNEKRYETSDGDLVTLDKMVRVEPGWAASRIRAGEVASRSLVRLRGQVADLHAAVEKRMEQLDPSPTNGRAAELRSNLIEVAEALRLMLMGGDDAA